jgi:hypothetical protein
MEELNNTTLTEVRTLSRLGMIGTEIDFCSSVGIHDHTTSGGGPRRKSFAVIRGSIILQNFVYGEKCEDHWHVGGT